MLCTTAGETQATQTSPKATTKGVLADSVQDPTATSSAVLKLFCRGPRLVASGLRPSALWSFAKFGSNISSVIAPQDILNVDMRQTAVTTAYCSCSQACLRLPCLSLGTASGTRSSRQASSIYTRANAGVICAQLRKLTLEPRAAHQLPPRALHRETTMYVCLQASSLGLPASDMTPYVCCQVLPDSLGDALQQASEATSLAISKGANRCIVSC